MSEDTASTPAPSTNGTNRPASVLVLIHGLAANRLIMWPMARRFRQRGFRVANWGYASLVGSIEGHANRLRKLFHRYERNHNINRIDVVAHSLGCIVARAALANFPINKLRRTVLLSPPNQGTRMARLFAPVCGWAVPAIRELSSSPDSYVNQLPDTLPCETGIIAAKWDILVGLEQTHLPAETEHELVRTTHLGLVFKRSVVDQCEQFLERGSFVETTT